MATSRRRERELARRRFERRRQAELERRAKAKKRNTVLGAVIGTVAVIVVLVLVGLSVFGGNGSKKNVAAASASPTATPTSTAAVDKPAPKKCKKISPNPPAKGQPTIPDVKGKDPTKLVTKDIKVGHGPAAKDGDNMKVDYIGIGCSTGTVFDATYKDGGKPLAVTNLGQAQLIEGFNKGLVGMKAGGQRELIIPGPLAYASTPSSAPTFGNDTLIFYITAKSVTPVKSSK